MITCIKILLLNLLNFTFKFIKFYLRILIYIIFFKKFIIYIFLSNILIICYFLFKLLIKIIIQNQNKS